jgi:shikimate kinase
VIAAAGGTVLDPANRRLLSTHPPVVWLRADPATLADRLGDGVGRPLLEGDSEGSARALRSLAAKREPRYAEVATIVVDVDGLAPPEIVEAVEIALRDRELSGQ